MIRFLALFVGALFAAPAWGRQAEVDIVVDMTPAGRKIAHPDSAHPAYYFPVVGGWKEKGALVAGEHPPVRQEVIHLIAVELAKQGYFVVKAAHKPDLVLSLHWGSMNPMIDEPTEPTGTMTNPFYNQKDMLALVGGDTLKNLDLMFEQEDVRQAAKDDRYFVVVSAYDFERYAQTHQKVLLWQAKMSVPSSGIDFTDVMKTLIRAGGPLLGRETTRPKMLIVPITPEGKVLLGTPQFKDYQEK